MGEALEPKTADPLIVLRPKGAEAADNIGPPPIDSPPAENYGVNLGSVQLPQTHG